MNKLDVWLQRLEKLNPSRIELGLSRLYDVLAQHPLHRFTCPVITVTGTNGKGSICAYLQHLAQAHQLNVGLYTSPHLFHFNERIRVHGQAIDDTDLIAAFEYIDQLSHTTSLTYFEFTTLAALYHFQQAPLDLLILEVGLGGRLDAVNVVDPTVSVISNIDLDHCQWLGPTRHDIAQEKAGILREQGIFICGDRKPPAILHQRAQQLRCQSFFLGQDFHAIEQDEAWIYQTHDHEVTLPKPHLGIDNAAVALCAWQACFKQQANDYHVLSTTQLPGRFQCHIGPPTVIFDVAHNPAAMHYLVEQLQHMPCSGKTFAIIAMLADKAIAESLKILCDHIDIFFIAPLDCERAASLSELAQALPSSITHQHENLHEAWQHAQTSAQENDRILITGSFYTVAALLTAH